MKKNLFILITLWIAMIFSACSMINTDYFIFENLAECEQMEQALPEGAQVERTDALKMDPSAKDLLIRASYASTFTFEGWKFEIAAFELESEEQAQKYFFAHTGKESDSAVNYSALKGASNYRIVAIDGVNGYVAKTAATDAKKLDEWLSANFSLRIDTTKRPIRTTIAEEKS